MQVRATISIFILVLFLSCPEVAFIKIIFQFQRVLVFKKQENCQENHTVSDHCKQQYGLATNTNKYYYYISYSLQQSAQYNKMEPEIQFHNFDVSNPKIHIPPYYDNSINLQMLDVSNSQINHQHEDSNISFTNSPYEPISHFNLIDQNSIRLPPYAYHLKTQNSGRKLMMSFIKTDLNPQQQQKNFLFNTRKEEHQNQYDSSVEIEMLKQEEEIEETPQFKQDNKRQTHTQKTKLPSTRADSSKGNSSIHSFNLMKQPIRKSSIKGLKELSLQVKQVLDKKKTMSYKQIANIIIGQQCFEGTDLSLTQRGDLQKSNQNIRRRIYDSLNVLVAVGVFKRNGKKGLVKNNQTQRNESPNKAQIKTKEDLVAEIQKARTRMSHKKKILNSLSQKYNVLSRLHNRNSCQPCKQSERLYSPIFFSSFPQQLNKKLAPGVDASSNQVTIRLSPQGQLMSELDMLSKYSRMIFQTR